MVKPLVVHCFCLAVTATASVATVTPTAVGALPVDNKNHLLNNHPLLPVTPTGTGTRYNYCIPVAVAVGRGGVGVGVGVEGVTTTAIITKTTNDVTKRKDQMRVRPPAAHCELACLGSELFFESVMFG